MNYPLVHWLEFEKVRILEGLIMYMHNEFKTWEYPFYKMKSQEVGSNDIVFLITVIIVFFIIFVTLPAEFTVRVNFHRLRSDVSELNLELFRDRVALSIVGLQLAQFRRLRFLLEYIFSFSPEISPELNFSAADVQKQSKSLA